ncbi:hypothetical protein IPL68_02330 [Candidatus Saccharibacteria bacterium]|nr:MAG: hypothetical protein IPL68_02330 [Candidatus Saccharibacteria bacterium]
MQLACTLIPETHGWRVPLHRTLASLSGLMLLPIEWLIFTSLPSITSVRFSFIAGIVTQLALLATLVLKRRSSMPWTFQVAYYAGFFLPLMVLTFFHTQLVN